MVENSWDEIVKEKDNHQLKGRREAMITNNDRKKVVRERWGWERLALVGIVKGRGDEWFAIGKYLNKRYMSEDKHRWVYKGCNHHTLG